MIRFSWKSNCSLPDVSLQASSPQRAQNVTAHCEAKQRKYTRTKELAG